MAKRRQGSTRQRHSRGCGALEGGRCACKGAWQIRYRTPDGRQREEGGFASAKLAESALRDRLGQLDRGTYREIRTIGFREFSEAWLAEVAPEGRTPDMTRVGTRSLRASTAASYRLQVRAHLQPWFGDVPVSAIRREDVRRYLAAKLSATKPDNRPGAEAGTRRRAWSAKSVVHQLGVLVLLLDRAVEDRYARENVAKGVPRPQPEPMDRDLLTLGEVERVAAASDAPWGLVWKFLAQTGLRRGELCALRWGDVQLDDRRIFIRKSRGRYGEAPPKSRAGVREVPLSAAMAGELRGWRLQSPPSPEGFVFPSEVGTALDGDNISRAWARSLRRAGVRHVPLHSLRATAVSVWVAAGGSVKTIQQVVGHATAQLTMDTYARVLPNNLDDLAARLDAAVVDGTAQAGEDATEVRGRFVVAGTGASVTG